MSIVSRSDDFVDMSAERVDEMRFLRHEEVDVSTPSSSLPVSPLG